MMAHGMMYAVRRLMGGHARLLKVIEGWKPGFHKLYLKH